MREVLISGLVFCGALCMVGMAAGQAPVGALAVDESRGDQYGWAVDYETTAAAREAALRECGPGCSVVLSFDRCGAYAADQAADSTAVGWAESYASANGARLAALTECSSRGGSGCVVRAWGCNGSVVEEALGLERAARRQIQEGLRAAGFDPGDADGLFGPRTRAAIRRWQASQGARTTGYLNGAAIEALRSGVAPRPAAGELTQLASTASASVRAAQQKESPVAPAAPPTATAAQENLFWQSVMNSSNPADFEAYLEQFPNGVFRALAENRLAALRASAGDRPVVNGPGVGGVGSPVSEPPVTGVPESVPEVAADGNARWRPGSVFRDCDVCPEMVVLPGGDLALGRYEVTVGEYRAFVSATGGGAGGGCSSLFSDADSWRNPGFSVAQTDRHSVTCVSWDDAQAYVLWLSRTTGARYRLPTEAEWERAAVGSDSGCHRERTGNLGTCPIGSYGSNAAGLSDMVGNLWEWTADCAEGDCGRRVLRGGSWDTPHAESVGARGASRAGTRHNRFGFRVARTLGAP